MFPNMKKMIHRQLKDQQGIALIAIVFLLWALFTIAITQMLVVTGTQLAETNLEHDLMMAESHAIATASPVRVAMDKEIYSLIDAALQNHLNENDAVEKKKIPSYNCQGIVSAGIPHLSQQFSICDPLDLFTNPQQSIQFIPTYTKPLVKAISASGAGSLNDLAVIEGLTPANLQKEPEFQEVVRELTNNYTYTLSSAYVGEQLLQPPTAGKSGTVTRIEQYRWLVRANIAQHTYQNITYPITVNYDVVTTVIFNDTLDCSGFKGKATNFGGTMPSSVTVCTQPANSGYSPTDPRCTETATYPAGSPNYQKACGSDGSLCVNQAKSSCEIDPNTGTFTVCPVATNSGTGLFQGRIIHGSSSTTGCEYSPAGSGLPGPGYTWSTAIRIVGIGNIYN